MPATAAGFRDGVRYLRDAGFVYLDDGRASFRMDETAFDALLRTCMTDDCQLVIAHYPSLFRLYDSVAAAQTSVVKARFR